MIAEKVKHHTVHCMLLFILGTQLEIGIRVAEASLSQPVILQIFWTVTPINQHLVGVIVQNIWKVPDL